MLHTPQIWLNRPPIQSYCEANFRVRFSYVETRPLMWHKWSWKGAKKTAIVWPQTWQRCVALGGSLQFWLAAENLLTSVRLVRGALTRHMRFLVVASQSGLMPTQTTMPPTQKSQLTTAQSLSYPTYWVIIYQLALWYLHDKYYLICNPWKYPQSFPMPSALSAILYLFLGGSLWLE